MHAQFLTEAMIRSLATSQSFDRGEEYYRSGAVMALVKRGSSLTAEVVGNEFDPYTIRIELMDGGIRSATCSCPYNMAGYCKHLVAVLLTLARAPEQMNEQPAIPDLLANLDSMALRTLLVELLEQQPQLATWVEQKLAAQNAQPAAAATARRQEKRPPIDPKPFKRRAHDIMGSLSGMRQSEAYWHIGGLAGQMDKLLAEAEPFMAAGDSHNALTILTTVTEVFLERWLDYDDSDGDLGGFFSQIGEYFAEALLCGDLTLTEREDWADTLTEWQGDIGEYGIDEAFDVAIAAAVQGWDDPHLQAALAGQPAAEPATAREARPLADQENEEDEEDWEDEEDEELTEWVRNSSWFNDKLTVIRLRILENQGRTEAYLNLARAEGRMTPYLTMLVKLDRTSEAIDQAMQGSLSSNAALALAKILVERGHSQEAIQVAEQRLEAVSESRQLAEWLRDFAVQSGRLDLGLRAARIVFQSDPSLQNYQTIQHIAGDRWPDLKPELLAELAQGSNAYGRIDIYLAEDMIDEAIQVADKQGYLGFDQLRRLVDAAYQSHPDWAIHHCRRQAEPIMAQGKSDLYHHAADWLERAKRAYLAAGRADEWRTYLEGLISTHARKYSLRPRLEALRKG